MVWLKYGACAAISSVIFCAAISSVIFCAAISSVIFCAAISSVIFCAAISSVIFCAAISSVIFCPLPFHYFISTSPLPPCHSSQLHCNPFTFSSIINSSFPPFFFYICTYILSSNIIQHLAHHLYSSRISIFSS